MEPHRSDHLRRLVGVFFILFPAATVLLTSGCLFLRPTPAAPSFTLSDAEVRQAGALALYSKGLLLESAESGDTNASQEAARQAFRQACRLDPDNPRPLTALLNSLDEQGRHAEALQEAERFLKRHPDDQDILFVAAHSADEAELPAKAARHCEVLLAAQPDNRSTIQSLIRLYFEAGKSAAALRLLREQHRRYQDDDSAALPVQCAVHFSLEDVQPALALRCLNLALEMRTNSFERAAILMLKGENLFVVGQTNAAVAALLQAYREDPVRTFPLLRIGKAWSGDPEATNRLARLAQRAKAPPETLLLLAATQQAQDDTAAAAASLRAFYTRSMRAGFFPDEGFYLWLASLLESGDAYDEAVRLLLEAAWAHPSCLEIKNFLAYLWAEKGVRLDEADRLSTETLRGDPENAAYLDTKGWILFKRGRVFDALQYLLRAAENDSEEPVILDHVGDALLAAGRESEAVAFWSRSHTFDPQPSVADKLRNYGVTPPQPPSEKP